MKKVKMFMPGVVALALLSFLCAPMVQAQDLADTTHEVKLSASAVSVLPSGTNGFVIERTGGKVAGPVVLRSTGANGDTGGFDYDIKTLGDTGLGQNCAEETIGTLSTYGPDENIALGMLAIVDKDVPEDGLDLFGSFFAQVKINPQKPGKSSFKSVAGWAEVVVHGAPGPDPDGMTKNFKVQGKEKTLQKLGLQCDLGPAL